MKNVLFGLMMLLGVAATAAPIAAPRAAVIVGGVYGCPAGWQLVAASQYVTYNVVTGYTLRCGPLGHVCLQTPVYQCYTQLVPANYCVPGVIVY